MCGIVGYVGEKQAAPILLDGLSKLEYRGYDSAGIAVFDGEKINMTKAKGRLKVLEEMTHNGATMPGVLGIGHTRWATHGEPSDVNAHPHMNKEGTIAVVHNGIIENYLKLKKKLIKKGYEFISDTDTEVIAHLLDYYYDGNPDGAHHTDFILFLLEHISVSPNRRCNLYPAHGFPYHLSVRSRYRTAGDCSF